MSAVSSHDDAAMEVGDVLSIAAEMEVSSSHQRKRRTNLGRKSKDSADMPRSERRKRCEPSSGHADTGTAKPKKKVKKKTGSQGKRRHF